MTISAGTRLGPYEIVSPLGAGGMGEVYKARDTRLERTVAVKVLPQHLSSSPEVRQRFEREAKTISQLSHPHICALYDVGREGETEYLVMEYLEGETLSERLSRGSLPVEQTLKYGSQIADALDKAHRQGIVHRDLKPGNVMLTKTGVKLLDFGLAKALPSPGGRGAGGEGVLTSLPTQQGLTQEGTILGTFQYMAPEQLEGKEADARTDIFAFGCVLYEMATGRKAFSASSQASLITAIMSSDPPPISSVQAMSPPALDRVVKTCLAKDPEDRWQSAADIKRELHWIGEGSAAGVAAPAVVASKRRGRERIAWSLAAAGLIAAAAALLTRRETPVPQPVRLTLSPPPGARFLRTEHLAVSPDGRRLAFIAEAANGNGQIWVQSLDSLAATPLAGTDFGRWPTWSPDGTAIAFIQNGRLRRVGAAGGSIQTISEEVGSGFGLSWGSGDEILLAGAFGAPLQRVPANGGKLAAATALDSSRGDAAHVFPAFLPDGRHFVFAARNVDPRRTSIALGELGSTTSRLLWPSDTGAIWAPPDFLLFAREGGMFAQPFDLRGLTARGAAVSVADNVQFFTDNNRLQASAGRDLLVYSVWDHARRLVWVDRQGREVGPLGEVADYAGVRIAPSGDRVAVAIRDPAGGWNVDLWVLDTARAIASRLSAERFDEFHPVWSADGERLYYASDRAGYYDLYTRPANGGAEEMVLRTGWDKLPQDVTPDGSSLIFGGATSGENEDVWVLPLAVPGSQKTVVESTGFEEVSARVSPDGRWIAFASDESGRPEIYVAPLPAGPKRPVSSSGGTSPVWSRDGKELYFLAGDGMLTAVSVQPVSAGLSLGAPQPLFALRAAANRMFDARQYDVAPDGRFLVIRAIGDAVDSPIVVDLNWTARLKK